MVTKVVHHNKEKFDVMIDRTTKWGNPYKKEHIVTKEEAEYLRAPYREGALITRSERIRLFEMYLRDNNELMDDIESLRDKTLGCWCKPNKSCHGDIIVKILDEIEINNIFGM